MKNPHVSAVGSPARSAARKAASAGLLAGLCLLLGIYFPGDTRAQAQDPPKSQKGAGQVSHAKGSFEVKLTPLPSGEAAEAAALGRFSFDKQFHGDLEATSKGEMLSAGSGAKGSSGGYVAMEKVNGTLAGRKGTFVLQHSGTMTRGVPKLSITVVPDSGTGELAGLTGKVSIIIADGKHSYDFEYAFSEAP